MIHLLKNLIVWLTVWAMELTEHSQKNHVSRESWETKTWKTFLTEAETNSDRNHGTIFVFCVSLCSFTSVLLSSVEVTQDEEAQDGSHNESWDHRGSSDINLEHGNVDWPIGLTKLREVWTNFWFCFVLCVTRSRPDKNSWLPHFVVWASMRTLESQMKERVIILSFWLISIDFIVFG